MKTSKTVLITGAAGGIGQELCRNWLEKGCLVYGLDLDGKALVDLEKEYAKQGWHFFPRTADVTKVEVIKAIRDEILTAHGKIDLWINNAGISALGDFEEVGPSTFRKAMEINLFAAVEGTRLAIEVMEPKGFGAIVNVASVAGHIASPYLTAYCASKHAIVGFTRALREEMKLKESPILISFASPGFVDTQMIQKGHPTGFPEWLRWTLSTPKSVAAQITRGIEKREEEIYPTWNGKLMMGLHRVVPKTTQKGSRLLLTKNLSDLLHWRLHPPK